MVYGRYTARLVGPDGGVLYAHVRVAYVWRRVKGKLKFSHIHGSHAQDIPLNRTAPVIPVLTADNEIEAVVVEGGNGAGTNRCRSGSLVLREAEMTVSFYLLFCVLLV